MKDKHLKYLTLIAAMALRSTEDVQGVEDFCVILGGEAMLHSGDAAPMDQSVRTILRAGSEAMGRSQLIPSLLVMLCDWSYRGSSKESRVRAQELQAQFVNAVVTKKPLGSLTAQILVELAMRSEPMAQMTVAMCNRIAGMPPVEVPDYQGDGEDEEATPEQPTANEQQETAAKDGMAHSGHAQQPSDKQQETPSDKQDAASNDKGKQEKRKRSNTSNAEGRSFGMAGTGDDAGMDDQSIWGEYLADLTEKAEFDELFEGVDNEKAVQDVLQNLAMADCRCVLVTGEGGCGKSTLVSSLAHATARAEVPSSLKGSRVIAFSAEALLKTSGYSVSECFTFISQGLMHALDMCDNPIVVLDGIDAILAMDSSFTPAWECIASFASKQDMHFVICLRTGFNPERSPLAGGLGNMTYKLDMQTPSEKESAAMAQAHAQRIGSFHGVSFADGCAAEAVRVARRYMRSAVLPASAINLMDTTAVRTAARGQKTVMPTDVDEAGAYLLDIPIQRIGADESRKYMEIEKNLRQRVVGQDAALTAVANTLRISRAGLADGKRPIGSFLFAGTTGTGKTELAKALAEYLFDDESAMVRLDMSEYSSKYSTSKLFGTDPGYIGFEEGGQLTNAVLKKPYCVVLLDEIEKAAPEVCTTLLQVLEDGRMTDGHGKTVDFTNSIIIMTSNIGAEYERDLDEEQKRLQVQDELRKHVSPEFVNRIDNVVIFDPLSQQTLQSIMAMHLNRLAQRTLLSSGIRLTWDEQVTQELLAGCHDIRQGARGVRRAVQSRVEPALSMLIIGGGAPQSKHAVLSVQGKEVAASWGP